jgi:hypothetical protein
MSLAATTHDLARFILWLLPHLPCSHNPLILQGAIQINAHRSKKRAIHAIVVPRGLPRRAGGSLGHSPICVLTHRVLGSVQSGFNEIALPCSWPDHAARSHRNLQIERTRCRGSGVSG